MATSTTLEKSLTARLRGSLTPAEIKQIVKSAAAIQKSGIVIDDAFPLGKPRPDVVSIRGHLPIGKADLLGTLLGQLNDVRELRVFPRGIIDPDRLRVHLNLGP